MSRAAVDRSPANLGNPANPIHFSQRPRLRMNMHRYKPNGLERYGRMTRRAQFLADMDWMVPWARMAEQVQPYCAQPGAGAPRWLERMLRIYFLQRWFNLSDLAVEESLYDSAAMRDFARIDLVVEAPPDAAMIGRFRDLLQRKRLEKKLASQVPEQLRRGGIQIELGTIVDATTIGMPSSARIKEGKRELRP